jgi:hypothetical protein
MPTIPLLSDPVNPNGSHHLTAPGGYEGWHFDASSDDGRVHLVAGLHEAWAFHPKYVRRYAWYRRFPTRIAPPAPLDYPAVTFALCEAGRRPIRFTSLISGARGDDVRTTDDGRSVRIGANHAERSSDRSVRLHLRGTDALCTIAVDLTFRPIIHANREVTFHDSPALGLHRWVIVDPLCEVEGSIAVFQPDCGGGTPAHSVSFAGRGFHDHRYGTRPPPGIGGLGGRVLLEDRALVFEQIGHSGAAPRILVTVSKDAIDVVSPPAQIVDGQSMNIGMIHLTCPCILQRDRFHTLLTYDARVGGEAGIGLCRRFRPRRWVPPG